MRLIRTRKLYIHIEVFVYLYEFRDVNRNNFEKRY